MDVFLTGKIVIRLPDDPFEAADIINQARSFMHRMSREFIDTFPSGCSWEEDKGIESEPQLPLFQLNLSGKLPPEAADRIAAAVAEGDLLDIPRFLRR